MDSQRHFHYRQLAEFTIECQRAVHVNLDGEPTSEQRLDFSVLPELRVVF